MKYCFQLYVGDKQLCNEDHENVYRLWCLYLKALQFNINSYPANVENRVSS